MTEVHGFARIPSTSSSESRLPCTTRLRNVFVVIVSRHIWIRKRGTFVTSRSSKVDSTQLSVRDFYPENSGHRDNFFYHEHGNYTSNWYHSGPNHTVSVLNDLHYYRQSVLAIEKLCKKKLINVVSNSLIT